MKLILIYLHWNWYRYNLVFDQIGQASDCAHVQIQSYIIHFNSDQISEEILDVVPIGKVQLHHGL